MPGATEAERGRIERDLRAVDRKLDGMYDALADGLRTPGLLAKIEGLERQKAELEAKLDAPGPSPVRLHPNLADLYRQKVSELSQALSDPTIRDEAIAILRSLIEEVRLGFGQDGWTAELQGEITQLVSLGMQNHKAPRPGLRAEALCSAKVVAGQDLNLRPSGYEPDGRRPARQFGWRAEWTGLARRKERQCSWLG